MSIILLLQRAKPNGLFYLHAASELTPVVVDRLGHPGHGRQLHWSGHVQADDQPSSMRMIRSSATRVRFIVQSPSQSRRTRTLAHLGPISGVHDTAILGRVAREGNP